MSVAAVLAACRSPSDVLPGPGAWAPGTSRFGARLTFAPGPDVVRGALPDGRVLFRTQGLSPYGASWIVVSIDPDSGPAREEGAVYRRAFAADVGSLTAGGGRRVLSVWTAAVQGLDGCPAPAPAPPSVLTIAFYELDSLDGIPIASLPTRAASTGAVAGSGTTSQRVRVSPALREMDANGGNPFGPALAGNDAVVYSDGDSLWMVQLGATADAKFLGLGAYPATSPDRRLLAFARPVGLDSAVATYRIPVGITVCSQEQVEVSNTGWEIVLRDLDTGFEAVLGAGLEPAFDPLAERLLARDDGILAWYLVSNGARSEIPGSEGSFAAAITPDGSTLAFSRSDGGNTDVFATPIAR